MRARIPLTIYAPSGAIAAGASVTITDRDNGAEATVYAGETGGGTTGQPLTANASGRVPGWLERGGYEALITGVAGADPTVEPFEIAPARDGGIDLAWLASELLAVIGLPVEVPVPLVGAALPAGWLLCDGSNVLVTAAPQLAAKLGATWGAAPAGSFKLPDLRGRTLVGADRGAGRIAGLDVGEVLGAATRAIAVNNLPEHAHALAGQWESEGTHHVPSAAEVGWTVNADTPGGGAAWTPSYASGSGAVPFADITAAGWLRNPDGTDADAGAALDILQPSAGVDWILRAI